MQQILSFPESRKSTRAVDLMVEALAHLDSGDREAEIAVLRTVLESEPDNVGALINLGTALYETGKPREALEYYQKATEAAPWHAMAFFNLGNALEELQRFPEAVEAYSRAIAVDCRYCDPHYNLALVYTRMGKRRKAIPHWSRYIKLDPCSEWTARARSELRRALRVDPLQLVS